MKLIQEISEAAKNAAQAQEDLNQAVINGKDHTNALECLTTFVGEKKAAAMLKLAKEAAAEKKTRDEKLKESMWGKVKTDAQNVLDGK